MSLWWAERKIYVVIKNEQLQQAFFCLNYSSYKYIHVSYEIVLTILTRTTTKLYFEQYLNCIFL